MSIMAIVPIIGGLIDKLIPDPSEKMKLHLELAKLADAENARASQEALAQSDVNKIEAGHRSIFVAGWRPAIGWVCGGALVYNVIVAPLFSLPTADLGFLQTILLAMLGISVSRTVEKIKGVSNDVLPMTKAAADAITAPLPK
jgi:hypothetical protein